MVRVCYIQALMNSFAVFTCCQRVSVVAWRGPLHSASCHWRHNAATLKEHYLPQYQVDTEFLLRAKSLLEIKTKINPEFEYRQCGLSWDLTILAGE